MTIEEAIKHCEEAAAGETEQGKCSECAADHKQLAGWLRELVALRTQQASPPNDPLTLEQLRELTQAEKDGRLVVLDEPMKPLVWGGDEHDSVLCPNCNHNLMGGFKEDEYYENPMYQCPYCGCPVDTTMVLTREEAEEALKKREADNETD